MEFYTSIDTATHIIQPLAYNRLKKIRKLGAPVHSANEQYEIHKVAHEYPSNLIRIPKPHYVDGRGYVMDVVYTLKSFIPHHKYCGFPELVAELVNFMNYMFQNGYWIHGFSIFQTIDLRFVLLDFSMFGHCQGNKVKFPKDSLIYSLDEAHMFFGFRMCGCGDTITPPPSTPILQATEPDRSTIEALDLASPRGPMIFDMDEFLEYVSS